MNNANFIAVFDFDQTLLDTSSLEVLRAARQWGAIRARAKDLQFRSEMIDALEAIYRAGAVLAVASSAPRSYLNDFLPRLPVTFSSVLGFHDAKAKKTSALMSRRAKIKEAQLCALTALYPLRPFVFVGDDRDDEDAAAAVGMPFVHACWGGDCGGLTTGRHCQDIRALPNLLSLSAMVPDLSSAKEQNG